MSEKEIELPRVKVINSDAGQTRIGLNFQVKDSDSNEADKRLLALSNEWTKTAISFFEVFPFLSNVGYHYADHLQNESIVPFLEEHCVSYEDFKTDKGEEGRSYIVHDDDAMVVLKKLGKTQEAFEVARIMKRSTLSSLVAEYEYFLGKVIMEFARKLPQAVLNDDADFKLKDLSKYDDIDSFLQDALERRVEKEIHNLSNMELLTWIGKTFSIKIDLPDVLRKEFGEICQRRHIIVHNGGVVSQRYISCCEELGWKTDNLPSLGERLSVDTKYLMRATSRSC